MWRADCMNLMIWHAELDFFYSFPIFLITFGILLLKGIKIKRKKKHKLLFFSFFTLKKPKLKKNKRA